MKNILISVGSAVAVVVLAFVFFAPKQPLGAQAGPEFYSHAIFNVGLTVGGGIRATSTDDTTAALLYTDFDTEKVIDFTPTVAGITLSLPASTTLSSFLTRAGDTRTVFIRNATTTAAAEVIVAGGTGTLLKVASSSPSSATIYGDTDGGNYARLDFVRKANTDIEVLFQSFKD